MARGCNDHRADLETGQMELDDGSDDGWSRVELHPLHLHSKYFKSERWSLKDAARIGHWAAGFSTETATGPDWTGLDRAGQFQPPASLISTRQSSISANLAGTQSCSLIVGSNEIITLAHSDWLTPSGNGLEWANSIFYLFFSF